jgi:cytidyltransferase-like protein
MNIGLFFGSFNPIHIGHMAIANYMVEFGPIDQLWFVVTPKNPLKKKSSLLHDFDRFDMVRTAITDDERFQVTDIEFHLPKTIVYHRHAYLPFGKKTQHITLCLLLVATIMKPSASGKTMKNY